MFFDTSMNTFIQVPNVNTFATSANLSNTPLFIGFHECVPLLLLGGSAVSCDFT